MADPDRWWKRLPRPVYWIVGAIISLSGAAIAKSMSDDLPVVDRVPYWLAGSTFIFLGLFVLSLGTKSRTERRSDDS